MARVMRPRETLRATSAMTSFQKLGARAWPRMTSAMSFRMYAAIFAIPNGRVATISRRKSPHVTTARPDSQRMRRTAGIFRRALIRSRHGLPAFTRSFKSLLK